MIRCNDTLTILMPFRGVIIFLVALAAFVLAATTLLLVLFNTKRCFVIVRRRGTMSAIFRTFVIQGFCSLGLVRVMVLVTVFSGVFTAFDFLEESLHERFNGFVKIHQNDVDYIHGYQYKSLIPATYTESLSR